MRVKSFTNAGIEMFKCGFYGGIPNIPLLLTSVPNNSFYGATFAKKTEQKRSILTKKTEQNRFFVLAA